MKFPRFAACLFLVSSSAFASGDNLPCSFAIFKETLAGKNDGEVARAVSTYINGLVDHLAQAPGSLLEGHAIAAIESEGDIAVAPLVRRALNDNEGSETALRLLAQAKGKAEFAFDALVEELELLSDLIFKEGSSSRRFERIAETLLAINRPRAIRAIENCLESSLADARETEFIDRGPPPFWVIHTSFAARILNKLKIPSPNLIPELIKTEEVMASELTRRIGSHEDPQDFDCVQWGLAWVRAQIYRSQADSESRLAQTIEMYVSDTAGVPFLSSDLFWIQASFGAALSQLTDVKIGEKLEAALVKLVQRLIADIRIQTKDGYQRPAGYSTLIEVQQGLIDFAKSLKDARLRAQGPLKWALWGVLDLPYMQTRNGLESSSKAEQLLAILESWRER